MEEVYRELLEELLEQLEVLEQTGFDDGLYSLGERVEEVLREQSE